MRQFSSYGPVSQRRHYCVPRSELVQRCVDQLVGDPEEGGHFFTIWAPRQTGKTWLMRRAKEELLAHFGARFTLVTLTLQRLMKKGDPDEVFLRLIPARIEEALGIVIPPLSSFQEWPRLFRKQGGLFHRPVILFVDEFDSLTRSVIDSLVGLFRQMYLSREAYHLHGLALIGVRAVLGVDSDQGSPFNIQRSLQVPNLDPGEVQDLFSQYQTESGQPVDPIVVKRIYEVTRGQPGLVSWFGELLTDKYNRTPKDPITLDQFNYVYQKACQVEPNNTLVNLLQKARRRRVRKHVVDLFRKSNIEFDFNKDWCNYLFLNGVLTHEEVLTEEGRSLDVCRFASPFVQRRLYSAFADDMSALAEAEEESQRVPAVNPQVDLSAVFDDLDLPALLASYKDYLQRLKKQGHNPFHGHPSRRDLHLREAVGHFHLYWWLLEASGHSVVITPCSGAKRPTMPRARTSPWLPWPSLFPRPTKSWWEACAGPTWSRGSPCPPWQFLRLDRPFRGDHNFAPCST